MLAIGQALPDQTGHTQEGKDDSCLIILSKYEVQDYENFLPLVFPTSYVNQLPIQLHHSD